MIVAASLNRIGGALVQQPPPVTLPKFAFADIDIERMQREAAAVARG